MDVPDPGSRVVLVVDDEREVREAVCRLLERRIPGVRALAAADGAAGLDLLRTERVDLLITDYRMPGLDGVGFAARARETNPDVPRILLTAHADMSMVPRAVNEAHVASVVTKPFDPQVLVALAQRLLDERAARHARDRDVARALSGGPSREDSG